MSPSTTFVVFLVLLAGIWAWTIHIFGRVNRHVASMLEGGRIRWSVWPGDVVLDGLWDHVPVQIRSHYVKPGRLTVTMKVPASTPPVDAWLDRSGNMVFRLIRTDRLLVRTLARAGEADLVNPHGRLAEIAAYFTSARVQSLRILLDDLKWERFVRTEEGIAVSRSGAMAARWKQEEAREQVLATLVQLENMERGA